ISNTTPCVKRWPISPGGNGDSAKPANRWQRSPDAQTTNYYRCHSGAAGNRWFRTAQPAMVRRDDRPDSHTRGLGVGQTCRHTEPAGQGALCPGDGAAGRRSLFRHLAAAYSAGHRRRLVAAGDLSHSALPAGAETAYRLSALSVWPAHIAACLVWPDLAAHAARWAVAAAGSGG